MNSRRLMGRLPCRRFKQLRLSVSLCCASQEIVRPMTGLGQNRPFYFGTLAPQ
jgi:hypothetical protein